VNQIFIKRLVYHTGMRPGTSNSSARQKSLETISRDALAAQPHLDRLADVPPFFF